jgi:hypothetical protein
MFISSQTRLLYSAAGIFGKKKDIGNSFYLLLDRKQTCNLIAPGLISNGTPLNNLDLNAGRVVFLEFQLPPCLPEKLRPLTITPLLILPGALVELPPNLLQR